MPLNRHSRLWLPLVALAVIALAMPSSGQDKYRGRYLTENDGRSDPVLTVALEVLGYSTPEETTGLVRAYNERGAAQTPYSGLMFLVAILEVDAKGRGEAKIYEDATCRFIDGQIVLDEFKRAPKFITGLSRLKK